MCSHRLYNHIFRWLLTIAQALLSWSHLHAQSSATLQGRVVDPAGAAVPGAIIVARHQATGEERTTRSDSEGNYQVAVLPVGTYRVTIHGPGFQTQITESLTLEVGRNVVQDFRLRVGDISQEVTVTSNASLIEQATTSVGHVLSNGRIRFVAAGAARFETHFLNEFAAAVRQQGG